MTACKYWDCGWCYAPNYLKTNAIDSTCVDQNKCPISPLSEPVQYKTPMTMNEQEIEKVKAQIKVLQSKLSFLEELEKTKSPVEEAFKDWMGVYPPTNPSVDNIFDIRWRAFQKGYDAAYEEKVSEWEPTPQTPEQVEEGLRNAMRTAIKEGIIPEIKEPTDELIDKLTKNPPEFLKFELGKSLTDLIYDWWEDVFTTHSDWEVKTSIDNLVDEISLWLPKYQSAAGSQSLGVEDMVSGFNDCLDKIRRKLR
jgi:hypothetical protein